MAIGVASGANISVPHSTGNTIAGANHTIAMWLYPNTFSSFQTVFHKLSDYEFYISSATTGYRAVCGLDNGVTFSQNWTTGEWQHLIITRSTNDFTVYRNNVQTATWFLTGTTTGTSNWVFGSATSGNAAFNGRYAAIGIYAALLDAGERASLAAGVSPGLIRPQSLRLHLPCIRDAVERIGGSAAHNSSPTVQDHPRLILPASGRLRRFTTAAAAAGAVSPYYYRHLAGGVG